MNLLIHHKIKIKNVLLIQNIIGNKTFPKQILNRILYIIENGP